ncbi:hypothetical protein [Traorella massiliensis]|uniref:hypothetical protein n=1 Tax=Traorella massiliensis TaxID=1903263 RepID=UPI00248E6601|nr:hypothetical protein [Traorella massiliensis]
MKKKYIFISIVIILLFSCGYYYLQFNREIENIEFSYNGINGVTFEYELDTNLNCRLENKETIFNGDTVNFECSDPYLSFIKENVKFEITDLFSNEINLDVIKKSSIVMDSEIVYINDGDYISIYILDQQDTESYQARLYENLYVNNDKLIQYVDGDMISDVHEMKKVQIDHIANEYLSDYITLFENQGFQRMK